MSNDNQRQQRQPSQRTHPQGQQPQSRGQLPKADKSKRITLIDHRTPTIARLFAVICTLLWVTVILGGLAVIIIYLTFKPRSPQFDISSATLNTAYIDSGSLLNADLTFLANISNPNKKIDIYFDFFGVDLYYGTTLIATTAVDSFSEMRQEAKLGNFHLVSSQVALPLKGIQRLKNELANSTVSFNVKGMFRTKSSLGRNFLHFKYWLHGRCSIVVSSPPYGALLSSKCKTKR